MALTYAVFPHPMIKAEKTTEHISTQKQFSLRRQRFISFAGFTGFADFISAPLSVRRDPFREPQKLRGGPHLDQVPIRIIKADQVLSPRKFSEWSYILRLLW